jgi:acetoacetyl-CoA synthetase
MLGGLACGARIILYDGSPFYPDVKTYLRIIDEQEYVHFFPIPTPASIHMGLIVSHFLVRAPASCQRSKAVGSSHTVSGLFHTLSPLHNLGLYAGDVGKFEAMRRVISTGSVLTSPQFEWLHRAFNDRLVIASCSGGTDICGACGCSTFFVSSFCFHNVIM